MKDVRVYYFNDTKEAQRVYLHTLHERAIVAYLEPARGVWLTVSLASDQAVFVKSWGHKVLIGRTDE